LAVKIRLMRVGKKKQPSYRVVVSDSRSPRDGRFIEVLGQYAPRADPSLVQIDSDRALHWLRVGAQPTEQVGKLLEISGVWAAYKEAVGKDAASKPKAKTPKVKKVVEKPEPAPAPAPAPAAAPAAEVSAEAPPEEAATEAPVAEAAAEAAAEPEATEEASE
jgi:small subunit ribosomal protein S16